MTVALNIDTLGLVFFTALFLSLFAVPLTVTLARRVGAVDVPKDRSSHSVPTARLGGLGIAGSVALSCLMFLPLQPFTWAFLAGLLVIVATGLIDDIRDIGPRWKFVGQIAAAAVFTLMSGGSLVQLGSFLGMGEMTLEWMAVPFTIFCMVGGMNAMNLADGLDGLAGGLAAIAAVFFAYFSWVSGAPHLLLVCLALLGAVLGFLRYNSHPARLFMGDSGSLTLGYVLGAVLVNGSQQPAGAVSLVSWTIVMALPLLDTLLVMARRVLQGRSPFHPDRTHLHHRLLALGIAHPGVVVVMYLAMAGFGLLGVGLHGQPDVWVFAAIWLAGAVLFGAVSLLERRGVSFAAAGRRKPKTSFRQYRWFTKVADRMIVWAAPMSLSLLLLLCLPVLFIALPEMNRSQALAFLMVAGIALVYGVSRSEVNRGILHGALYVSIFALVFLYNLAASEGPGWEAGYLWMLAAAATLWVVSKMIFRKNATYLKTSAFELLMVLLSWFLPFVLFEDLKLPQPVIEAGRVTCLQVIPFMIAAKIYFNAKPQDHRWLVGGLSGAMAVVALRGLLG